MASVHMPECTTKTVHLKIQGWNWNWGQGPTCSEISRQLLTGQEGMSWWFADVSERRVWKSIYHIRKFKPSMSVVPNFIDTRDQFHERRFFHAAPGEKGNGSFLPAAYLLIPTAWFLPGHRQVTGIGPWPRGLGTPGLCNPVYHPPNFGSSHHWTDSQMNSRGQFVVLYQ